MNAQPLVLVAGFDAEVAHRVEKSLTHSVDLRLLGEDVTALSHHDELGKASLAIAKLGNRPENALEIVTKLTEDGVPVLVVAKEKNADLILAAMRAGAREFLVEGKEDELRQAVNDLVLRATGQAMGRVTCVYPAKGGVGATAIATNLAGALHRAGEQRVCVIDLDLHFGDVLSFLDLQGGYSISDVVGNIRRLDRELLDSSVTRHRSGVFVLAQSDKLEQAENVKSEDIATLLGFLRRHYDHVIVDGLRGLDDVTLAALDDCDRVLLVVTQDVPAVRNAQRCISIFQRLTYPMDKITLVVNRYQKKSAISLEVIGETAGLPAKHTVVNDFAPLIKAINHGVMLVEEAKGSRLTKSIVDLVPLVRGDSVRRPARRGLLGGLLTRSA